MKFATRNHAGQMLARRLHQWASPEALVYALPRGGVPVGVEVALALHLAFDLVIPRRLGHPTNRELAVGAVTENGEPVLDLAETKDIDAVWLDWQIRQERAEARRRRHVYRNDRMRGSAANRCAILVDDGIATGFTMEAAVREVRADGPSRVVVAVGVASRAAAARFRSIADDFVANFVADDFTGSVGAYYDEFPHLDDAAVLRELARIEPTA